VTDIREDLAERFKLSSGEWRRHHCSSVYAGRALARPGGGGQNPCGYSGTVRIIGVSFEKTTLECAGLINREIPLWRKVAL
jgi:hypothetical protein